MRVIPTARERLAGPTVTVGALVAISEALGGYLADRGGRQQSCAEVPMAFEFGQEYGPSIQAHKQLPQCQCRPASAGSAAGTGRADRCGTGRSPRQGSARCHPIIGCGFRGGACSGVALGCGSSTRRYARAPYPVTPLYPASTAGRQTFPSEGGRCC